MATVMVTLVICSPSSLFCQLQCWSPGSALLGQHWDFHGRTGGPQQGLESWDRAGSGQTSFEPVPIPFPQPTQP